MIAFIVFVVWTCNKFQCQFNIQITVTGNASICRQITNPASMRDVEWSSQSCLLTFNTIGVWPETIDGTDLNTCARSNNHKFVATGDDFGKIKLYSYPVTQPKVILFLNFIIQILLESQVLNLVHNVLTIIVQKS
jgi:hypothetical protein